MEIVEASDSESTLTYAMRQMLQALDILDEVAAPGEISSHLDLAICRLAQVLGLEHHSSGLFELMSSLDEQLLADQREEMPITSIWNDFRTD